MTRKPELAFHKMHGAGNDFVLLDLRDTDQHISSETASRLAHRQTGIGCDQLLILHPASRDDAAARYEIRNSDGSPAGQCGNGARCIGLYLDMQGEMAAGNVLLQSPAGPIEIMRCDDGDYEVDMGQPGFDPASVPLLLAPQADGRYRLDSPWGPLRFGAATMGNPHALLQVDDIEAEDIAAQGAWLGQHEVFPEGCNVGFAQIVDRQNIRLRVVERGAGETLACGSGACAAAAILQRADYVDGETNVFLPGGRLVIKWAGTGTPIRMKGPAIHVFRGYMSNE